MANQYLAGVPCPACRIRTLRVRGNGIVYCSTCKDSGFSRRELEQAKARGAPPPVAGPRVRLQVAGRIEIGRGFRWL